VDNGDWASYSRVNTAGGNHFTAHQGTAAGRSL
jgi:hypothetical protein